MEELEDVMDAQNNLSIRTVRIHDMRALWEIHQTMIARILRQERVVLVGEFTPTACVHRYIHANAVC